MSTASSIGLPSAIRVRGSTRATRRAPSALPRPCAAGAGLLVPGLDENLGSGDGEVDEDLCAERLGVVTCDRHAPVWRRTGIQARILEVFRPDPEQDRASDVLVQPRMSANERVVDAESVVAEADREMSIRACQLRLDHVDRRRPDEPCDEVVDGTLVERLRRRDLLQLAVAHHGDTVAQRHRLRLVMRDVERRHAETALEIVNLATHLHAQLRVEIRERLIHEKGLRLAHDRPPHRHPLALSAGQGLGLPREILLDLQDPGRALHTLFDLRLRQLPEPEAEGKILLHGHVRVERVVLEHHRDVPFLR